MSVIEPYIKEYYAEFEDNPYNADSDEKENNTDRHHLHNRRLADICFCIKDCAFLCRNKLQFTIIIIDINNSTTDF